MKECVSLRPKMYNYLTDGDHGNKKAMDRHKCVKKREIKFPD